MTLTHIITCPVCHHQFALSDGLGQELRDAQQKEIEAHLASERAALKLRHEQDKEAALKAASAAAEASFRRKEAERLALAEAMGAREAEIADMKSKLMSIEKRVSEAREIEKKSLDLQTQLENDRAEFDLLVQKKVFENSQAIRESAKKAALEEKEVALKERDLRISQMQKTIDDLKRQSEQGSQQLQGEVQEILLEEWLRQAFPADEITPVLTGGGKRGADVFQSVNDNIGAKAGSIIWESKNTARWNPDWIGKLKDDQHNAKADIAVIVSLALPSHIETIGEINGVWVCMPRFALPIAALLRKSLVDLARARNLEASRADTAHLLYDYLTGPEFRHRIELIVETFEKMHEQLRKERAAMTRSWAEREKQIDAILQSTVGMYGDLQGIAGSAVAPIAGIEFDQQD